MTEVDNKTIYVAHLCKGVCRPWPSFLCSTCKPDEFVDLTLLDLTKRHNKMKYRIFDKKKKLFVDDPAYPNNQRTWSEFYVGQDGKIVEFITGNNDVFFMNKVDQKKYKVVYLKG
jgi:hypothetical protein